MVGRNWESTFSDWTGRASDSEQDRYEWTRDQINEALAAYPPLRSYGFKVYAKGSYPNFTNVVRDSDVDVAAELTDFFTTEFDHDAAGLSLQAVGESAYTGSYTLPAFKDDVERALISHFGRAAVDRGKKAILIRETSRGLAADVVPCNTHRVYTSRFSYRQGIKLLNDEAAWETIKNFPAQHLKCGTDKNDRVQRRYKRVVRILKRLENEMVDRGVSDEVPSFLIESAVFSVPDHYFLNSNTWTGRVQGALAHIWNGTTDASCMNSNDWLEVSRCKFLFFNGQNWTYQQAHQFADTAWKYLGFR